MHPLRLVAVATFLAVLQLAAPAAADVEIRITPGGYVPDDVTVTGGTSVANLTDPSKPKELASYPGKAWASYWYNGRVYSRYVEGGLRVFKYAYPSPERLDFLNPQTQISVID